MRLRAVREVRTCLLGTRLIARVIYSAPPSGPLTAQALGLAIPDKLLALADEVMSEAQRHGGYLK
jgi:hypothetical protein